MLNKLKRIFHIWSNPAANKEGRQSRLEYPVDFTEEDKAIIRSVKDFTMTSNERLYCLIQAVKYVVTHNIDGDIVECGVWKGGSMMAVAKTLSSMNIRDRNLYLFDSYEGMPEPSDIDTSYSGKKAFDHFRTARIDENSSSWCFASLDEVRNALFSTGYDKNKIHFVKGRVEETIPRAAPSSISILRLDTDWYNSTKHELIHLFPRLSRGGVIIIDDYGHWQGAKKAVDEYISENGLPLLLNRIDYTARIAVKLW